MNGASYEFFSGARFASNQHSGISTCDCLDLLEDLSQGRALTYNLFKMPFCPDFVLEVELFISQLDDFCVDNAREVLGVNLSGTGLCSGARLSRLRSRAQAWRDRIRIE